MVTVWGMSDKLGPITYEADNGMDGMYMPFGNEKEYSEKTAEKIDKEVKMVLGQAYSDAKNFLETNRENVEGIAKALLKYETLDAADVKVILDGGQLDKPTVADLLAAEQAKADDSKEETGQEQKDKEN